LTNEDFYNKCAIILETTHEYTKFPDKYRTRWNNRKPGSGRFPDRGIIRCFGSQVHIALNNPTCYKICDTKDEALELLNTL